MLTYTVDINHQRSACKIHLVTLIHKFLLSIRDFIFCVPHRTPYYLYDINNLINISTVWRITKLLKNSCCFSPSIPLFSGLGAHFHTACYPKAMTDTLSSHTHRKRSADVIGRPRSPVSIIFLSQASRLMHDISRYPSSSGNPEDHVSDLPSSAYHDENDDP